MSGASAAGNLLLQPGDAITVPKAELVYVVGDVKKAGGFALSTHSSVTLLQASIACRGFWPGCLTEDKPDTSSRTGLGRYPEGDPDRYPQDLCG